MKEQILWLMEHWNLENREIEEEISFHGRRDNKQDVVIIWITRIIITEEPFKVKDKS
jgi:hypothetical protein